MLDQFEEDKKELSLSSFAFKQGLYLGLFLIIFQLITHFTDQSFNRNMNYITYLIMIGVIVWSMNEFRKENGGYMTYSQGLGLGTLLSASGAAISAVFSIFYMKVIDPGFTERLLNNVRIQTETQYPQLTDEQLEASLKMTEWIFQPIPLFFLVVIVSTIFGFILSLIISLFFMKSNPDPFA